MAVAAHAVQLDLPATRRWALTARTLLAEARGRIDALNVFPVPDGDTGTNLYLTVDGALDILRERPDAGSPVRLSEGLALIARGMLLSARGNSGVILSQLMRGLHEAVADAGAEVEAVGPEVLADAFARADALAWAAVTEPVEGTILSVSRAVARDAAETAARPGATAHTVALGAVAAARDALARTPEQLPVLARAGVVDAGGAGLVVVLEALERVLAGAAPEGPETSSSPWLDRPGEVRPPGQTPVGDGDGTHEVMYLLTGSDPHRAQRLRAHLAHVGASVLVVGGPEEWRVHVHVDDPQVALEAGAMAGRVADVRVSALPGAQPAGGPVPSVRPAVGVVACASGEGLAAVLALAGAEVVRSAPGARASTGELLSAVWAVEADAVVVLPNDPDTVLAARAAASAAREEGLVVEVVPSAAAVQGLAALAVLHPDGDLPTTLTAMREAVAGTRHGAVTRADKAGHTPAGPCREGQGLGLVGGRIVAVADDPPGALRAVLAALLTEDTELLTVVLGADGDRAPVEAVLAGPDGLGLRVEVQWVDGGQRSYPWLLGAE